MHEVSVASKKKSRKSKPTLSENQTVKEKGKKTPSLGTQSHHIRRRRAVKIDHLLDEEEIDGSLEAVEALEREPERSSASAVLVDDNSAA
jgi:hypothetical protein